MIGLLQFDIVPRRPSHVRRLFRDVTRRPYALAEDERHVQQAVDWLVRALDARGGRGIPGGYSMNAAGWAPVEMTASALATIALLNAGQWLGNETLIQKAVTVGNWMMTTRSSRELSCHGVGNSMATTAVCVDAWMALFERCDDERFLSAARVSACRLASDVEQSGHHSHVIENHALQVSRAILAFHPLGDGIDGDTIAKRLVEGILERARPNGWIDSNGDARDVRVRTFRVATTAESLFQCARLLKGSLAARAEQVALAMAEKTMLRFERNKPRPDGEVPMLPAFFDQKWKSHGKHACNAGCAQMATLWLTAYRRTGDVRFVNGALKILDQLKSQQSLHSSDSAIRGAIPGTAPIWRSTGRPHFPTTVTTTLLTALIRQECAIEELQNA